MLVHVTVVVVQAAEHRAVACGDLQVVLHGSKGGFGWPDVRVTLVIAAADPAAQHCDALLHAQR